MNNSSFKISTLIKEKAPIILAEIERVKSILLHCHPGPDPDSVGSALAMKFVLEKMGKKATIIKGDSDIPEDFGNMPGVESIEKKNYFETDLSRFDLFIILDGAALNMITKKGEVVFPTGLRTIVIDHHKSNDIKADINLVEYNYPATAQVLSDLFLEWGIEFDRNISENLFLGLYTDSKFKYLGVNAHTFEVAAILARNIPSIPKLVYPIENSNTPGSMVFKGLGSNNIEVFQNGHFAISAITYEDLKKFGVKESDIYPSDISSEMRSVKGWFYCVCLVEVESGLVRASFRSQDGNKYDISLLASTIGGGGHKEASGAVVEMNIKEVKELLVKKANELYNA